MNTKTIVLLVVTPAVALIIGCIGLELIHQTILGWIFLGFGIGYPLAIILYSRFAKRKITKP